MKPVPISTVLRFFIGDLKDGLRSEADKLNCTRMLVRIRFGAGPKVRRKQHKNQHLALAMSSLLTPGAVMAAALAFWRIAADLKATGQFPISDGLFSHWQVWLGAASLLQLGALALNRYGKAEPVLPKSVDESQRKLANF